ncbi:MAG: hypothetical protein JW987_01780 [Anaerolineaceae bacterium]|nr:hypothetical protein [Anaerolineaceae bacterium]
MNFIDWVHPWINLQVTVLSVFYDSGWAKSIFFLCGGLVVVAFMVLMIILAIRSASQDRPDSSSDE